MSVANSTLSSQEEEFGEYPAIRYAPWQIRNTARAMKISELRDALLEIPEECIVAKQIPFSGQPLLRDSALAHGLYFASWRGIYSEPTLCSGMGQSVLVPHTRTSARDLLAQIYQIERGEIFEAYKGGAYSFSLNQSLWADEWGDYYEATCVGVFQNDKYFQGTDIEASFYIATLSRPEREDTDTF